MQPVHSVLIEAHYLPSLSYFTAISDAAEIIVEKYEHYQKQTFRNRAYINTVHGKKSVTIPVIVPSGNHLICDVRIDHSQKWVNNHWRTIQSAYGKAPFFEYYSDDLSGILFRNFRFLYDLNLELLPMCLKWLKWKKTVNESKTFEKSPVSGVLDLRSVINPKKPEGPGRFYKPVPYRQVFGNKFVENLSLTDLIFCEGPGAREIVQASKSN